MVDQGHILTDKKLKALEKKIAGEYRQANAEVAGKLEEYLKQDEAKRQVQEALLNAGKITQKEYSDWCYRHMMMGKQWEEMRDVLAADYCKANEIALKIAKGGMADIYALNANWATYQIEHDGKLDTSFVLYNHDTAEYLLEQQRDLMPGPSKRKAKQIAANKDMQWNKRKIQSAVLQGVLQGESPYEVARRLMTVGQMNYNAAIRYARTMTTNAQNAGRYQAYRRATEKGVDLTIEWQATLDGRTRHEHRMMHGQRRNVDEPFEIEGFKIMWPGNDKCGSSTVPQQYIWNCRCTLLSWVKGFEGTTVKSSPKMGNMTFEEWQNEKKQGFTSGDKNVRLKGHVSDQNTGKQVFFDEKSDFTISVGRYSDEVNAGLSKTSRELAKIGSKEEREYDALVDIVTGREVFREPGNRYETGTGFWKYIEDNGGRYAFVHNHCYDGSLSSPDLDVMLTTKGIDCMIAVRNDGVKYVAPKKPGANLDKLLSMIFDEPDEGKLVELGIKNYTEGYYEHDGRR